MANLIRIAAALVHDADGRVLVVRKRGTTVFMQAGGKIEPGETPFQALARELTEELAFTPREEEAQFLGTFSCPAANEPDHRLEAHLFRIHVDSNELTIAAELEEAEWVSPERTPDLPLAPFTRDHVLPLARAMRS